MKTTKDVTAEMRAGALDAKRKNGLTDDEQDTFDEATRLGRALVGGTT